MDAAGPPPDIVSRLRVQNKFARSIDFVVEPYGYTFPMEPQEVFEVVAQGPPGDAVDVVVDAESIEVWLWSGALLIAVYRDGVGLDIGEAPLPRVPSYPTPPSQ